MAEKVARQVAETDAESRTRFYRGFQSPFSISFFMNWIRSGSYHSGVHQTQEQKHKRASAKDQRTWRSLFVNCIFIFLVARHLLKGITSWSFRLFFFFALQLCHHHMEHYNLQTYTVQTVSRVGRTIDILS